MYPRESPRSSVHERGSLGSAPRNQGQKSSATSAQGYKNALRLSLTNQSFGNSSPSDISLRRNERSPRSDNDTTPAFATGSNNAFGVEARRLKSGERLSLKQSMDKAIPPKKTSENEAPVEWFLIILKGLFAFLLLVGGLVLGTLAKTGSLDWIYSPSEGVSPLFACPSTVELFQSSSAVDGLSCELRFSFSAFPAFDSSVKSAFQPNNQRTSGDLQCFQGGSYTECSLGAPCRVLCYSSDPCSVAVGSGSCSSSGVMWGSSYLNPTSDSCTQSVSLNGVSYPVTGAGLAAEPLCGTDLDLTPGMILTIRGELIAFTLIALLVVLALFVKARVAPSVRQSVSTQKGMMIAKASANELRAVVESRWDKEVANPIHNGPKFETGSFGKKERIHPAKYFAATSWKYRVRVMHAMLRKRNSRLRKRHAWNATVSSIVVMGLSFAFTVLLLSVLPGAYPFNTVIANPVTSDSFWAGNIASVFSPLYTGIPLASGVWVDALTLADVAVELVLVFLATLVGLRWQPLPSDREDRILSQIGASEEACLVILTSAGTCLKSRGKDKLVAAIRSALDDLKLGAVFVVDMGPCSAPLDDTWKIAVSIDPELVHYVYLPDTNKRLGEYWTSEIWIPFMHKCGRISRLFKQMLVMDLEAIDSLNTLSLGTLNRLLMLADGNIDDKSGMVVVMPTCSNIPGTTGVWESYRLRSEYYARMTEVGLSGGLVSSFSPSESINIVDRRTLEVLAPTDPVQSALAAMKKRGKVQISCPTSLEPFRARNTIYEFYRTQSNLLWNGLSQGWELMFTPSSFVHGQSVAMKFFLLLSGLLRVLCVIFRPVVFGTLLFRDPVALACLLGLFWVLSIMTNGLHALNGRRPGETKGGSFASIITYPIYQIYLGTLTIGLVIGGATYGRLSDDVIRPSVGSHKELYPCLPHPDVDWFTCWKTSDATRLSVLNSAVDTESPRLRSHSNDSLV